MEASGYRSRKMNSRVTEEAQAEEVVARARMVAELRKRSECY